MSGNLPVVGDAALKYAFDDNPSVFHICTSHTLHNVIKRVFDHKEYAKKEIVTYEQTYLGLSKFCDKADKAKKRKATTCPKSFNLYIWDRIPSEQEKERIARLSHDDFDDLEDDKKTEIKNKIQKYPTIHPLYQVRWKSLFTQLENVIANKEPITELSSKSDSKELLTGKDKAGKDWTFVNPDWEMLEGMHIVLKKLIQV